MFKTEINLNQSRIEMLPPKLLVGKSLEMSPTDDRTAELWGAFMPFRKTVPHRLGTHFMSMQVYPTDGASKITPATVFQKWAVVEVSKVGVLPEGMVSYDLLGGKYAVFVHNGPASAFAETMKHIFQVWLPSSGFQIDSREHFELLEEGYSPTDPEASEEVWVPIK